MNKTRPINKYIEPRVSYWICQMVEDKCYVNLCDLSHKDSWSIIILRFLKSQHESAVTLISLKIIKRGDFITPINLSPLGENMFCSTNHPQFVHHNFKDYWKNNEENICRLIWQYLFRICVWIKIFNQDGVNDS